ncbi:hypothetical protein B0H11DRAFT_1723388 [Mycena galericulata]|nr:hypothetical protein B0H11DRAFT_1723388 [Mycena galericulata]
MVAAFVSEYGWLALWTLRPGKNRDGYYNNAEILKHATAAMDILDETRPHEHHAFANDNAKTHTAWAPDALSARDMVVKPPTSKSKKKKTFLELVRMRDGQFADGTPQSLYFPDGHPQAGIFKGMRILIHKRIAKGAALPNPDNLNAQHQPINNLIAASNCQKSDECPGFKCPPGRTDCCCRRILFTQPDFVNQKSMLEEHCEARGHEVIFFPKFHCEVNCIEQCWGFAKRIYRMRSDRFIDAYQKGLSGSEAAWANKRYRGHSAGRVRFGNRSEPEPNLNRTGGSGSRFGLQRFFPNAFDLYDFNRDSR